MFAINKKTVFITLLISFLCGYTQVFSRDATYYADSFEGARTSLGDTFRQS